MEHIKNEKSNYLYYLIGLTSYALPINTEDKHMKEYLDIFKGELNNRK